ncbi:MAG TPA: RNA methyltransferase [Actinomycetes bacterium]|nr:RNA methyltransferase [Actinomycetes bacterium]
MASPELINPRSARVKDARRLVIRASRHESRRFLAEGVQAVREGLAAAGEDRVRMVELFATVDAADRHAELVSTAATAGVDVHVADDRVLASLSETVTPQGLVAVCEFLDVPLDAVLTAQPRLMALLAEVRDPGNAGSVLRAADAAGADAVVFSAGCVDAYNGKVVRASVGGLFHLPVVTDAPLVDTVRRMKAAGVRVLAADGAGDIDLDRAERESDFTKPTAWVFGNEARGLPPEVAEAADAVVRIPIYGKAESLNLATAAALCLYASARAQRADHP